MSKCRNSRHGLSLVELLAVVTLLGIFASAAMMRFGRDTFADAGARSEARLLSLALLNAQRSAIRTGESHGVVFQGSPTGATGWTLMHRLPNGSTVSADAPHFVPDGVILAAGSLDVWFDFEGVGPVPFSASLRGKNRSYEVRVEALTRMVVTDEVKR